MRRFFVLLIFVLVLVIGGLLCLNGPSRLSRKAITTRLILSPTSWRVFASKGIIPLNRWQLDVQMTKIMYPTPVFSTTKGAFPSTQMTTTTTVPVVAPTPTTPSVTSSMAKIVPPTPGPVTPQLYAEWEKVAICEVGGDWAMQGPVYSGIGFLNSTWDAYGGLQYAPNAGEATPDEQILIGMKITGGRVPDQYGCSAW